MPGFDPRVLDRIMSAKKKQPINRMIRFQSADQVNRWLKKAGTAKTVSEMSRYGIPNDRAFGVPMAEMKKLAKQIGRHHELACELWQTEWYESRTVAGLIDDPSKVTSRQMDQWVKEFDSWAICDTVCFHLFDRTRFAWSKVPKWASSKREFVRRAGFAMIWALSVHDKESDDSVFLGALETIESCPADERLLVKKAIDMALRAVGKRGPVLNRAAIKTAQRLSKSDNVHHSWIGRHSLKELQNSKIQSRWK